MTILEDAGWEPRLAARDGALHQRLLSALREDVKTGRLAPGLRLPTHRDLAYRLKIGVGTVTRAYAEAEVQGLITCQVGRGSFVAARRGADRQDFHQPIDLTHNLAPAAPAARRLREAVARLARRADLIDNLAYAPPAGLPAHRQAGAAWLSRSAGFETTDWRRLLVCGGAQQALTLVFGLLCRRDDTILTEAGSFFGLRGLAEHAGYRLHGVAMDGEGLEPEALAKAAAATCARVLYTLPTFQNPTGRTQSRTRREDIARVARAHNLTIVEDDIYAAFAPSGGPAPLSVIAPERSFYISGVSKVLGPGLRTGYVVAPDDSRFDALVRAASVTAFAPPNFGALIATQWIEDGTADQIAAEVCAEMVARRRLAQDILGASVEMGAEASPHVWMPLSALEAERLARRALRAGVEITPPSAPIVEPSLLSGLRLCLGSASDQAELACALKLIAIVPGEKASNDGGGVL